jgi:RNA polymerase sigma-70 factor (ECF subfamily)
VSRAADDTLTRVLRREGGRLTAVLARQVGDLQLAEDALQDAGVAAVEVWGRTGTPHDPASWLYVAARRKAIDLLRREDRRDVKERDAAALADQLARELPEPSAVQDDLLRLVFTCCHPALDLDTRVALALRTLCGLSTLEVARVLLVGEAAMAKRLTRAKAKIAHAGIPFRVPSAEDLPARTAAVCAVVHLVYTAGHSAASGDDLLRDDLCDEAVRLARLLVALLPDQDSPEGLLALLLLTDARRGARTDADGEVVTLADQDRSTWDGDAIAEGLALLDCSLTRTGGQADTYQLQAAIASCHATAPTYADTDWAEILRLYRILDGLGPNPVVRVNAAVARAEVDGPAVALADLDAVEVDARGHAWHTVRADLLARLGRPTDAAEALDEAIVAAPTGPERRHLERRRAAILTSFSPASSPAHGPHL